MNKVRERDMRRASPERGGTIDAAAQAVALAQAADLIHGDDGLEAGLDRILTLCAEATGAEVAVLVQRVVPGRYATRRATTPGFHPEPWTAAAQLLERPRRIADLDRMPWGDDLPEPARGYRALLSAPMGLGYGTPMAIVLLGREAGAFGRPDKVFLGRVCRMLDSAFERRQLTQRNAVLADLVAKAATPPVPHSPDTALTTLSRALARNADWLSRIVAITNRMLGTRSRDLDSAINTALEQTGRLAGSDRTYVFRLRAPDRIDNTHEWVAEGIEPMIAHLQDVPASTMDDWRDLFDRGEAVYIPDVSALAPDSTVRKVLEMQSIRSLLAVPMLNDGRVTGFVGYDSVRDHRLFLPTEIQLIQSVANAINVVLERASAEAAAEIAQSSLVAERDRLRATLGALPDLVLELDIEGRFVAFNEGTGLEPLAAPDVFLGSLPEGVLPPELANHLRTLIRAVDSGGIVEGHDYELVIDGVARWFVARATALSLQGRPRGYIVVIREITQRRAQLRQIQRLAKVAELTSNLVLVTDRRGRIEWVNPAFERRSGWQLDDVRGKLPTEFLLSARTSPLVRNRIERAYHLGEGMQAELLAITRDNDERWISIDIQPLRDEAGEIQGFVSVATDITGLKQSELRALHDRAQAMEISNDGIAICEVDGPYTYMNRAHREMFGIGPLEDIRRLTWRDLYPAETVARFLDQEWPHFIANRAWRGELVGRTRDGARLVQEVSLTLKDDGNLLCITRDTSEQVRIMQEQARLREELQIANRRETIAQIASEVAHDLNNLVAVVSGTSSLLEGQAGGNAEIAAGISRIRRAMATAHDLVAGLGNLGRPAAPRARHDLRRLVGQGVDLLGSARLQRHEISVRAPSTDCEVWANPTDLLQVVVNLALNACESEGPDTATPPRVSLSVWGDGSALPDCKPDVGVVQSGAPVSVFTVSDTGAGIDAEARARLFERYYTTKGQGGTGLGLPIIAAILRDNDAAMWFDSTPGAGTTVTVAWPSVAKAPAAGVVPRSPRRQSAIDLAGRNILVVDDVDDVTDVLAAMLEAAGAVTISVSDSEEAGRMLVENPGIWSALVTDLHMPRVSGADLARIAATLDPPVPTVLVTALAAKVGTDAVLFDAVLSKPVESARLLEAVRAAVGED